MGFTQTATGNTNPENGSLLNQIHESNVILSVKRTWKMARGFGIEILITFAVAMLGKQCIPAFDIRGPFLMMSPFLAAEIFFLIGSFVFNRRSQMKGEAKKADSKLVHETALQFNFGHVTLFHQYSGRNVRLVVSSGKDNECYLPDNWDQLTIDARRFAIVRALVFSDNTGIRHYLRRWPDYVLRVTAMLCSGFNLWLILVFQGAFALWFAANVFIFRTRSLTQVDIQTLKVMRDLTAAIAFVKADPMNDTLGIAPGDRIASLTAAAVRLRLV